MSDIRPLGSEKLQGMDKIKRILEIASYNEKRPVAVNESSTSEYRLNLADGNRYEIVKEKNGYIIKRTINESTTDYIEPLENRKFYKSYSQALKRLNLMAKEFNTLYENEYGTELFSEQKKFFLKTPKAAAEEAPAELPAPAPEAAPAPAPDMGMDAAPAPEGELPMAPEGDLPEVPSPEGGEDMGGEGMPAPEEGGEDMGEPDQGAEDEVSLKSIQKLVGKLAQKLRTISKKDEEIDSKDIKYVINSVLSAVDLEKLEDEDKEEILGRFDSEEESTDMGDEDMTEPDMDMEDQGEEPEIEIPEPPKGEGELGEEEQGTLGEKFLS